MLGYVLSTQQVLDYYSRPEIRDFLFRAGQDRDTVTVLDAGILSRGRGNASGFETPEDIPRIAHRMLTNQKGEVPKKYPAFHGTISRYSSGLFRRERHLRGADMVFDIDIKSNYRSAFRQGARLADYLEQRDVPYRIKFSGGTGPHLILPCETFPEEFQPNQFKRLFDSICEQANIENVDTSFASSRHFLRLPYSLNEYSGLVSLPLEREQLESFEPGLAEASQIAVTKNWFRIPDNAQERMVRFITDILGRRHAS